MKKNAIFNKMIFDSTYNNRFHNRAPIIRAIKMENCNNHFLQNWFPLEREWLLWITYSTLYDQP